MTLVAILFVGHMPRGMHDLITGYSHWNLRALNYALLLTDAYPPFSFNDAPSPIRPGGRTALPSG